MIVDYILDREEGKRYCARDFYAYCMGWGGLADNITRAMDSGTNEDVQKALCEYLDEQDYNGDIGAYVLQQNWLEDDPLNPMCKDCVRLGATCNGTSEMVWTGCTGKNIE